MTIVMRMVGRVSDVRCTTVDRDVLDDARRVRAGTTASQLIDEALTARLARDRAAEIDEACDSAYRSPPIDEAHERGDPRIWPRANRTSQRGQPQLGRAGVDSAARRADGHARRIPTARELQRARWCLTSVGYERSGPT